MKNHHRKSRPMKSAIEKADRLVDMGIDGLLIQGMKGSDDYRYFAERYASTPLTLVRISQSYLLICFKEESKGR